MTATSSPFHFSGLIGSILSGVRASFARRAGLFLAAGLVLSGCQSSPTETLEDVAAGARQAEEAIGSGGTVISLLLPRSAAGETGRRARDIRDGAALALDDLGAGMLKLSVQDTGGQAGDIPALIGRSGARLVVGPVTASVVSALVSAGAHPPALVFTGNGEPHGSSVFAIVSDAVDSALETARIVAAGGRRDFVAIVPQGFAEADRARLSRGVAEAGATLAGFVDYSGTGAALAGQIVAQRELLVKADAVLLFGEATAPADIAAALHANSALQPNSTIIGNLAWTSGNFARPELEGALVAMPDQSSLAVISERYKTRTGRTLSIDAAYGYDAIAVAAGIVRVMGEEALTTATLTKTSGFRGATGIFRFMADGTVQRPLALYQARGGALQLLDAAPEGF